ncbi:hypothetical protein [Streptomyces sp.]|uniref:hypothetical protein n=1 Tax=Streptomyces sp. TaxID=1931 RepID=UPI002D795E13|nr:hypothetical protein [Streptomyces sp.]HET6359181.1 hypothetical protein [Streptomyces sp.]
MDRHSSEATLSWARDAIGDRLLDYLLAADFDLAASRAMDPAQLSGKRAEVVDTLAALRNELPSELDEAGEAQALRHWLMQSEDDQRSIARALREHVLWDNVPGGADEVENALIGVAMDAYPALLLPPEPLPFETPFREDVNSLLSVVVYHRSREFTDAAFRDPRLSAIFPDQGDPVASMVTYKSNTRLGTSLQLVMLPSLVIRAAWREIQDDPPTVTDFTAKVAEHFRVMCGVLTGETHSAVAKLAFTGVLLPGDVPLKFGNATVRPILDADRRNVPESLKGQLTGQDGSGVDVTVNYDGDVVLEYQFPYKVRLNEDLSDPWSSGNEMRPPVDIERTAVRLRFALMLAVDRIPRAQLIHTWTTFDEPLGVPSSISWSDPRKGSGFMPTQLTEQDVEEWGKWYARLDTVHVNRIELALSRILRAMAERRDPSDVLIDSVIAWENLFGTSQGEPTFRVTMCLAKLLEDAVDDRKTLKAKLGKIYELRSKVVHGSRNLKPEDYPLCQEALDVAIRAVRVLVLDRTDILELSDGAPRSVSLLLGD